MMENIDELDRLYEALTLKKEYKPASDDGNWHWACYNHQAEVYYDSNRFLHRIYGPAYYCKHYDVEKWYKHGVLHRTDGPAKRHKGSVWWYTDGKLHRLDGPAVMDRSKPKEYWINGQRLSPKEYKKEIERRHRRGLIK